MAEAKKGLLAMWQSAPNSAKLLAVVMVLGIFLVPGKERDAPSSPAQAPVAAPAGPQRIEDKPNVQACVQRAIAHYSSIGSYPTLSDGRNAADVAQHKCKLAPETSYR
ncbi:MAG: hypothetical protein U1E77_19405 [Inhella sp.]